MPTMKNELLDVPSDRPEDLSPTRLHLVAIPASNVTPELQTSRGFPGRENHFVPITTIDVMLKGAISKCKFLPDRKRPSILVVDDDPDTFDLIEDIFEGECEVQYVTNGLRALRSIAGTVPDLVVLDVMMPFMDGYEVCRKLKAQVWSRDIPVLFVSSLRSEGAQGSGVGMGAVGYLCKPIDPMTVKQCIDAHLREHLA